MLKEGLYSNLQIERTTLPNGLTIVTEQVPQLRSVCLGAWVRRGSRHEPRNQSGALHFIEHMLFKGTESRDTQTIAKIIDSIGGEMNAFTGKESTCFYARVLDEHLKVAVDLLADILQHPTFRPADVERERKVILEEIKMVDDTPDDLVQELFVKTCWKGNSLARPILGTRRSVATFTADSLREYFLRNIRPDSLVICAAGNLEHEAFVDLLWSALHELKGSAPPAPLEAPRFHAEVSLKRKRSLKQTYLCLGVDCLSRVDEDRYALSVLNTILGTGMSSRLFQRIREERSLAYDVFSETVSYSDSGYLVVYAGTGPESVLEVVDDVRKELRSLMREPVAAEELGQAQQQLKGSLLLGLESTFNRMSSLATQELYLGKQQTVDDVVACVERVSAEDVRRVALELFDGKPLAVSCLGKLDDDFRIEPAALAL